MNTYYEMERKIRKFLSESGISPYDLVRISKDLCSCRTCKMFVQHYSKDGRPVDFGHCVKNAAIKSRRPYDLSCGYWCKTDGGEDEK